MESKQIASGILRALLTIATVSLLLLFLFAIKPVLIYLGIAAVLSLVARPLLGVFRQRLKLPNAIAVLMTMSLFILFLFGLISLFIPLVLKQSENLSLLNSQEFKNDLQNLFQKINSYFSDRNIDIFEQLKRLDLLSNFNDIPNLFNAVLGGIGSVGIGLFSVLFISF
ncbi:MAG: AI-2E family transporter, partial [Flavicella sp.]|nr:AI-2E family transporter [Flavicella sp.]